MQNQLLLSKYGKEPKVYISEDIIANLTSYHVDSIRFLYGKCIVNKLNVVLNNENGMNEERMISAFLLAIDTTLPSLIVCPRNNLSKWCFEASCVNLNIVTADELIQNESLHENLPDCVLITHDHLKHKNILPVQKWSFFVVQNIDSIIKSRYIKNVNSQYKIAITYCDFMSFQKPETQWFIMKWANPSLVEDLDMFLKADKLKKENLLWPFPEYWKRLLWDTFHQEKPTEENVLKYVNELENWCKENKPCLLEAFTVVTERQKQIKRNVNENKAVNKKKRASNQKNITNRKNMEYKNEEDIKITNEDNQILLCKDKFQEKSDFNLVQKEKVDKNKKTDEEHDYPNAILDSLLNEKQIESKTEVRSMDEDSCPILDFLL